MLKETLSSQKTLHTTDTQGQAIRIQIGKQRQPDTSLLNPQVFATLKSLVANAAPLTQLTLDLVGRPENQYLRQQTEKTLKDLERLSLQWEVIKPTKYKYRQRFYDTHNDAIG